MDTPLNRRRVRLAIALPLVALVVLALAALSFGKPPPGRPSAAQYQYKIVICHKQRNTISVSVRSWPAHRAHNDTMGACSGQQAKIAKAKKAKAKKAKARGRK
jgi:hypothetical protein